MGENIDIGSHFRKINPYVYSTISPTFVFLYMFDNGLECVFIVILAVIVLYE